MVLKRTLASLRGRKPSDGSPPPAVLKARELTSAREWGAAARAWEEVASQATGDLGSEPWSELARANRLSRDLTAACEAIDQGRARFPDDLRLSVELARVALRGYAASAEDERHAWKAKLLDARALLALARERREVTKPALQAAGEIELVLRRWQEAVELWGELERRYPDRADEAIVKQATALRAAGEHAAARTTLERASAPASESDDVRTLAQTIAAAEDVADANAAFEAASARWHAGDHVGLRSDLSEAIRRRGHPEERVAQLLPLLDDLAAFIAAASEDVPDPGPERPAASHAIGAERDAVLVSGFLYSGSGAVFDLLRQYQQFHLPFGDRETGFLKKPGHLASILEARAGQRFPEPASVADAVLSTTVGFGQTGRPLLGWAARDGGVDRLVLQLRWLVAELRRTWVQAGHDPSAAEPHVAESIRRFIDAFLADRTPVDRRVLLNNAIVGHQLQHLRLVSRSVAVAVLRDPRDQYVSQRLESPNPLPAQEFIALMTERFAAYELQFRMPEVAARTITVSFEHLVTDPEYRLALLDRLGVPESSPHSVGTFRPEVSRRNIGIHAHAGLDDEVAQVADALLPVWERIVTPRDP